CSSSWFPVSGFPLPKSRDLSTRHRPEAVMAQFHSSEKARALISPRKAKWLAGTLILAITVAVRSDVAHATTTYVVSSYVEHTVDILCCGGHLSFLQDNSPTTTITDSFSDPALGTGS